jgi:hypothetical protein
MTKPLTSFLAALAPILTGSALLLAAPCRAETPADGDLAARQAEVKKAFREQVTPFVKNYCLSCHSNRKSKAGVNFESALKYPGNAGFAKHWKQALTHVRTLDMPPDDADRQPTDDERAMFVRQMAQLKYLSPADPGPFPLRRLNKLEYGNTLHDFLGVDRAVARELPDEVFGEGYLNTISPLQSEQYLQIANAVLERILAPAGAPPTPLQLRLFGESPAPGADARAAARKVAGSLARTAYRRPPSDPEVDLLLRVYDLGREHQLAHQAALGLMLKSILVSPQFLFLTPAASPEAGRRIAPVDDHQLASRLSYLLWATVPDAELAALADAGTLHEPAVLRSQTLRLLRDPRARALFDGFGAHWLGLDELEGKTFDTAKFPGITGAMRTAMYEEVRLFFESIVRENRPVVALIDSDYTFLNGTLATLYGQDAAGAGPDMRRVPISDANRGGILGMAGILATTSFPNRTSPVKRGVWVLEQLLGEHVPPPPPNVPSLEKQDQAKVANLTLRQRTELHRTDPVCANCHRILDPIGFGLENFDAIGRWRTTDDSGGAIDATGELPGGKRFSTPKELKAIIGARQPELARNLTEKFLAYALCRQLEGYDEIVVDRLMEAIGRDGYRLQTLITEVVLSYPFTQRRIQ